MSLNLEVINPVDHSGWDELLLSNHAYSFFCSSHWAKVLSESYHYRPLYFILVDRGRLLVLVPVMEIKSLLTGRRGVSLPFTDYCDPVINGDIRFQDVLDCLVQYGDRAGWRYIELRGGGDCLQEFPASSYYYGHTLEFPSSIDGRKGVENDEILTAFKNSTRRSIKRAIKEGVRVGINNSTESIKEFYRLNCMTRKVHGLPPQPYYFFKNLYDYVISKDLGIVALASYKGKTIAGAVFLHFGKRAVFKYGASDAAYQRLRPNNLVMWEAIRWYARRHYKSFCFGRTDPENSGLRRFKAGWAARERVIKYYRYDLKRDAFVTRRSRVSGFHNRVFSRMPVPLLKVAGSVLYRHMG